MVRKTTSLNDPNDPSHVGFVRTYYVDGKEVYSETLNQNLDIEKHTGKLPNGIVREFFDNGKVYFFCEFKNGQRNGVCHIYFENGKVLYQWYKLPIDRSDIELRFTVTAGEKVAAGKYQLPGYFSYQFNNRLGQADTGLTVEVK